MKKTILLIISFILMIVSEIEAKGILSSYRSAKRDAKTSNEIITNFWPLILIGVLILFIWWLIVFINDFIKKKEQLRLENEEELKKQKLEINNINKLLQDCEKYKQENIISENQYFDCIKYIKNNKSNYGNSYINEIIRKNNLIKKYGEENGNKIINKEYFLGMTKEQLIDSKCQEPTKLETEVLKTKTKETLIYGNKSSGDVFVFENDILTKFKDR